MNIAPQTYILGEMLETFAGERNFVYKFSHERQKYERLRGVSIISLNTNIAPPVELLNTGIWNIQSFCAYVLII
jgi:hypothetical protein